ncbi:cytochrome c [Rhodoferax sp. OV413]|uniref:c-type cytochrome n=1 Tax=Rhodoferax sp. OV413 TaxID=1855285 RepID=UPI0025CBD143|nr:cytochrome c [Rhodoferax sp. OV413]
MKKLLIALLACSSLTAFADDVAAGRAKSDAACALCHGAIGIATLPNAPSLAGQSAIYVSEQLKNYRSGKRQNAVMGVIAMQLTDADISNLAAWFSVIKVTAEAP